MGYIAPVTHYDYLQYAKRIDSGNKKPLPFVQGVNAILPVKFYTQTDEWVDETHEETPKEEPKRKFPFFIQNKYKKQVESETIQKTAAEITGKGRLFNEMI
ncbi:hypothetical protein [Peribacillus acanthi]|uniref:hypothetical protein n=1 Tax=Peribacillus acanthi TaxID=2171554 RepID=UPI000D3E171D|nr:hypothetical protein [Peribacillus acanthi]